MASSARSGVFVGIRIPTEPLLKLGREERKKKLPRDVRKYKNPDGTLTEAGKRRKEKTFEKINTLASEYGTPYIVKLSDKRDDSNVFFFLKDKDTQIVLFEEDGSTFTLKNGKYKKYKMSNHISHSDEDTQRGLQMSNHISHSAKGTHWKKGHKYIAIKNGRYIYPKDVDKDESRERGDAKQREIDDRDAYRFLDQKKWYSWDGNKGDWHPTGVSRDNKRGRTSVTYKNKDGQIMVIGRSTGPGWKPSKGIRGTINSKAKSGKSPTRFGLSTRSVETRKGRLAAVNPEGIGRARRRGEAKQRERDNMEFTKITNGKPLSGGRRATVNGRDVYIEEYSPKNRNSSSRFMNREGSRKQVNTLNKVGANPRVIRNKNGTVLAGIDNPYYPDTEYGYRQSTPKKTKRKKTRGLKVTSYATSTARRTNRKRSNTTLPYVSPEYLREYEHNSRKNRY